MLLNGKVKRVKRGTFTPQDGENAGTQYPYVVLQVNDPDGDGYVSVKADREDSETFDALVESVSPGDQVALTVSLDRFGSLRLVAVA